MLIEIIDRTLLRNNDMSVEEWTSAKHWPWAISDLRDVHIWNINEFQTIHFSHLICSSVLRINLLVHGVSELSK